MRCRPVSIGVRSLLVLVAWLVAQPPALAQHRPHAGMLRHPDVSATHIVFAYANHLWLAPREGGVASLVASPPGAVAFPRFSPDGQTIAFVGNYDGNRDLYTIPVAGGVPQRVTHHPAAETLCDWTADGRLLFFASGYEGLARQNVLFTVGATGGLPEKLPVPYGAVAAISPDGVWLAYTPHTRDHHTWKRYVGGMATDIWLFNLRDHTSKRITDWEGTDSQPMWHGRTIYYISDGGPEHKLNIWSYDTLSGKREQVTSFAEFDVKWPAIGPGPTGAGEIVFQYGADLLLLDLATRKSRSVEVTVPGDRPALRPQRVDVHGRIENVDISPTGQRAVLDARGDIWTVPARRGSPRNMTRTSGVAERDPAWSPDGRWIAYFSDETGEYELYVTQSDGKGETRRLTTSTPASDPRQSSSASSTSPATSTAPATSTVAATASAPTSTAPTSLPALPAAFRYHPTWSPDSKHIVFSDKSGALYLHTVEGGATVLVDTDPWADQPQVSWSHDSTWLAYTRVGDNQQAAIWLYHRPSGARHQLTSGVFHASSPAFDREGKYLYFVTNVRWADPIYQDVGTAFVYTNTDVLVVVPLRAEVGSPWAPKSDEETWKGKDEKKLAETQPAASQPATQPAESQPATAPAEEGEGGKEPASQPASMPVAQSQATSQPATAGAESKPAEKKEDEKKPVEIELAGFETRALPLPVGPGSFSNLAVNADGKLLYVRASRTGGGEPAIKIFDVKDEEKEEKNVLGGVGAFRLSADGKKLLVRRGDTLAVVDANPDQNLNKPMSLAGLTAEIDPRAEWQQVFVEAWRIQRDFFYDPHMHGVDWAGVRDRYATMLDDCVSRADVGYVIREMISELNVGHAYYWGDPNDEPSVEVGLLAADFELHEGAYRIQAILSGGPWDVDARGPLSQPGVKIKVGDYLLAVNGVPIDVTKDPWAAFLGLPGRVVTLTVSDQPTRDDSARDVVIRLLSNAEDGALRYRAWVELNRAYVAEKTGGKVGYIHVPDTGTSGQNELFRQFFGQRDTGALIIDERWNGGGQIPTRFIELLNRPVRNYWARRDGRDWRWPEDGHPGPKCMLINPLAGSGGDLFPYYFRQAGLGKLIGMRTWGGLVGISGNPGLIDGAGVTVPTFGFYKLNGTWGVEGYGVPPDIEVIDDPALMVDGGDPQLDAGIAQMLKELEEHPYVPPPRPKYPDRSGMGVREEDK